MSKSRFLLPIAAGASVLPLLLHLSAVFAQIPPHRPGEICVTPKLWCWARQPGRPGTPCQCPSPFGMISGTLR